MRHDRAHQRIERLDLVQPPESDDQLCVFGRVFRCAAGRGAGDFDFGEIIDMRGAVGGDALIDQKAFNVRRVADEKIGFPEMG